MLKHISSNEFEKYVLKSDKVVLVDFFATWCGPCQMLSPILEDISNSRAEFDIVKVDIDEAEQLTRSYEIESVPTMLIFQNGNIVDKIVGYVQQDEIIYRVSKYL